MNMKAKAAFAASALAASVATTGCSSSEQPGGLDSEIRQSSSLVLSPVADPSLRISIALVRATSELYGPESVAVTLSRGARKIDVPCDYLGSGGSNGPGERL